MKLLLNFGVLSDLSINQREPRLSPALVHLKEVVGCSERELASAGRHTGTLPVGIQGYEDESGDRPTA